MCIRPENKIGKPREVKPPPGGPRRSRPRARSTAPPRPTAECDDTASAQAAPAGQQAQQNPEDATDEPTEAADAKAPEEATEEKRICRYVKLDTATRRKTKVCRTVEEWRELNNPR